MSDPAVELAELERTTDQYRAWLARETCPHTRAIIRDELAALRRAKTDLRASTPAPAARTDTS